MRARNNAVDASAHTCPQWRPAVAAVALGAACAGQYWLSVAHAPGRSEIAWLVAGAAFLALLAASGGDRGLPEREHAWLPRTEALWFAALMAVTVFFRVWRLDILPPGLNHDAAWNGLYALRILRGEPFTPYVSEAWGRETLMMYLQAAAIRLFGPDVLAVIAPAILAATLLVPFGYGWAREMFGPRLALGASFLVAVSGWSIVFGRVGWRAVLQPTVSALAYFFFWRAWHSPRLWTFALAGVAAAGSLYTYNAARLVPAVFPAFVLLRLFGGRRRLQRRHWSGLVAMGLAFAVTAYPMADYAYHHWSVWQGRARATYRSGGSLWDNLKAAALMFSYRGNGDDFFVDTPLLEYPAAVLLPFGLAWCLSRPLDERSLFLLLGFAASIVPGVMTKPNGNRGIGALPFVYVFAALGGAFFAREVRCVRGVGAWLARGFVALTAVAAAWATYAQYFGPHRRPIWGFYPETTVLARFMKELVPRYAIWVGGANFPRDTLTYLTYQGGDPRERHYVWIDNPASLLTSLPAAPAGKGMAFILATIDQGPWVLGELQRRYPEGRVVELHDPTRGGAVFARALLVDPGSSAVPVQAEVPKSDLWHATPGILPGQLSDPKAVAVGPGGVTYVADTGNHRIQKFGPAGEWLAAWGGRGPKPGEFQEPNALALDSEGNLHVVDTWNHRIQKLGEDGRLLVVYKPPDPFFGPRGIAIDKDRAYVTDTGNNSVAVFTTKGEFVFRFGQPGNRAGQLLGPVGVAVTSRGLWAVDSGNNRLQAFDRGGQPLQTVPVPGWRGSDLKEGYLAVAPGEVLLMTDPVGGRILRLEKNGQLAVLIGGLEAPCGIALWARQIYVTERSPSRLRVFPLG